MIKTDNDMVKFRMENRRRDSRRNNFNHHWTQCCHLVTPNYRSPSAKHHNDLEVGSKTGPVGASTFASNPVIPITITNSVYLYMWLLLPFYILIYPLYTVLSRVCLYVIYCFIRTTLCTSLIKLGYFSNKTWKENNILYSCFTNISLVSFVQNFDGQCVSSLTLVESLLGF